MALAFTEDADAATRKLALQIDKVRTNKARVFLCGNGGSAANANHWANDLIYGAAKGGRGGVRAHSLSANTSVLMCLANDTGYENIFSGQLEVLASPCDILVALSGSGNSPTDAAREAQRVFSGLVFRDLSGPQTLEAAVLASERDGIRGSNFHDFLHARTAEAFGATSIVTLNMVDFRKMTSLPLEHPVQP